MIKIGAWINYIYVSLKYNVIIGKNNIIENGHQGDLNKREIQ